MSRGVSQEVDLNVVGAGVEEILLFRSSRLIRLLDVGYYINEAVSGGTGFSVDVGYDGGTEIVNASVETTPTAKFSQSSLATFADIPANTNVVVTVHTNTRTAGKIAFYFECDND